MIELRVLGPKESYLLHGGVETWPMESDVTAISLPDLMRRLADRAGT